MARVVYIPIRARRGRRTHAIALHCGMRTACDRPCQGWVLSVEKVDCRECLLEMYKAQHVRKIAALQAKAEAEAER